MSHSLSMSLNDYIKWLKTTPKCQRMSADEKVQYIETASRQKLYRDMSDFDKLVHRRELRRKKIKGDKIAGYHLKECVGIDRNIPKEVEHDNMMLASELHKAWSKINGR